MRKGASARRIAKRVVSKAARRRKIVRRKMDLKSSNWYEKAALSVGIPEDRRELR